MSALGGEPAMKATHSRCAAEPVNEREHVQLLLARLWAAEYALAVEIARDLGVSEAGAQVLARMRIEEVIDGAPEAPGDLVVGYPNESYCSKCWALVTPDTAQHFCSEGDLFESCVYCGRLAA